MPEAKLLEEFITEDMGEIGVAAQDELGGEVIHSAPTIAAFGILPRRSGQRRAEEEAGENEQRENPNRENLEMLSAHTGRLHPPNGEID